MPELERACGQVAREASTNPLADLRENVDHLTQGDSDHANSSDPGVWDDAAG